jgi:hypothetical protein
LRKRRVLQQVGKDPGGGTITTIDRNDAHGPVGQFLQGRGYFAGVAGNPMVNPGVICDNAFDTL